MFLSGPPRIGFYWGGGLGGHSRLPKPFTPGEILTVWAMVITAAGIPSSGLMRYLLPHIVAPHYFATRGNHWEGLFLARLPSYLFVTDPEAVRTFFEGLHRGQPNPVGRVGRPAGLLGRVRRVSFHIILLPGGAA